MQTFSLSSGKRQVQWWHWVALCVFAIVPLLFSTSPMFAQRGGFRHGGFGRGYRGYRGFHRGFGGFHRGYGGHFGFGFSYFGPYSYFGSYYGYYPYSPFYYPAYWWPYYGPAYVYPPVVVDPPAYRMTYPNEPQNSGSGQTAWLNLEIQPGNAAVYIDGQYAGRAADFGRGKKLLPVTPSSHTLRIEANGYQPVEIDLSVNPLQTLDVVQRLRPGSGAASPSGPLPSNRIGPAVGQPYRPPRGATTSEPSSSISMSRPPAPPSTNEGSSGASTVEAGQLGRINLNFDEAVGDAAVYIDGRFIGITDPSNPVFMVNDVPSGSHRVVVTRPGYVEFQGNVKVNAGQSGDLKVVMRRSAE